MWLDVWNHGVWSHDIWNRDSIAGRGLTKGRAFSWQEKFSPFFVMCVRVGMFPVSAFVSKMSMFCCPLGESGQCGLLKWTKRRRKSEERVKRKHYLCNVEKR